MKIVLCFICAIYAEAVGAYTMSPARQKFYCKYNGIYSDDAQVAKEGSGRTRIRLVVRNVLIPKVSPYPIIYAEKRDNGNLFTAEIAVISEKKNGIFIIDQYNITSNIIPSSGLADVNVLKSLTLDQLQENPNCQGSLTEMDGEYFTAVLPDCKHITSDGQHRKYTSTITCDTVIMNPPVGADEKRTDASYVLTRKGNKFPLDGAPPNYYCDCK